MCWKVEDGCCCLWSRLSCLTGSVKAGNFEVMREQDGPVAGSPLASLHVHYAFLQETGTTEWEGLTGKNK